MPKPKKKKISHRVLATELSVVIDYLDAHNFGYARDIIIGIRDRVNEYDLEVKDEKATDKTVL